MKRRGRGERGTGRDGPINLRVFYLLAHYPNGYKGQGWGQDNARRSIQVFLVDTEAQGRGLFSAAYSGSLRGGGLEVRHSGLELVLR